MSLTKLSQKEKQVFYMSVRAEGASLGELSKNIQLTVCKHSRKDGSKISNLIYAEL